MEDARPNTDCVHAILYNELLCYPLQMYIIFCKLFGVTLNHRDWVKLHLWHLLISGY